MKFSIPLSIFALLVSTACGDDGGGDGDAIDAAIIDAEVVADAEPEIDAAPAVTIDSVTPSFALVGGGDQVLISGTGFSAGGLAVTVGDGDCDNLNLVNDFTIQCTVPEGRIGEADLTVTNDDGDATIAFTYHGIYAADGKTGEPGNLYEINPSTGEAITIGPIGFAITGLALSPDGELFGSQSTQSGNRGNANLVKIDRSTGVGTAVGELIAGATGIHHNSTADIDFLDDRLIGWSETGDDPIVIDTETGAVDVIGDSGVSSSGSGIAVDTAGTVWFVAGRVNGNIFIIDPLTGLGFQGPQLTGGTFDNINSMTYFNGQLFAVDTQDQGSTSSQQVLVKINQSTGVITPIGPIPTAIDSIAASTR